MYRNFVAIDGVIKNQLHPFHCRLFYKQCSLHSTSSCCYHLLLQLNQVPFGQFITVIWVTPLWYFSAIHWSQSPSAAECRKQWQISVQHVCTSNVACVTYSPDAPRLWRSWYCSPSRIPKLACSRHVSEGCNGMDIECCRLLGPWLHKSHLVATKWLLCFLRC
jgi:hypothetical protein